jgi:hypothetical protein
MNGGATGLFIYAYSFHYFFQRSRMDGLLQVVEALARLSELMEIACLYRDLSSSGIWR